MTTRTSALALLFGAFAQTGVFASDGRGHGYKSSKEWLPRTPVEGAVSAETLVSEDALPLEFDWRNVNGKNLVTSDWNQHIPQYCGACWVHGTTSALNDRIKVLRGGAFPDVMLGRQAIINCVPDAQNASAPPPGCNGGDAYMIHHYLMHNKVPDETCMPYQARNMGCDRNNVCRNCFLGEDGCFPIQKWIGYGVSSHGTVKGEKAMMKEIYARGPIACSFATDGPFMMNYTENAMMHEGVYVNHTKKTEDQIDHIMEVAGWGATPSGLKYWVIRNSWGTYWGSAGWLKMERGSNTLLSESECAWAVPSYDELDEALLGRVMGDYVKGVNQVELPFGVVPVPAVSLSSAQSVEQDPSVRTAFMLVSTFASGIAVTILALRLSGSRGVHTRPLLG